jgi:hypothetical protein
MTQNTLCLLLGKSVVFINVDGLPGVVDPGITASDGGNVAVVGNLGGQLTLLGLVLVLYSLLAKDISIHHTVKINLRGEQRC